MRSTMAEPTTTPSANAATRFTCSGVEMPNPTATRVPALDRPAFLALAVRVGAVRLIDNVFLDPAGPADRGRRLDRPSALYAKGR